MPTTYIKREVDCNLPPNMGVFKTKHVGVRIYNTNTKYIYKKPQGIIIGTNLTSDDCQNIQLLFDQGCSKSILCRKYNISRYYLNKVLTLRSSV